VWGLRVRRYRTAGVDVRTGRQLRLGLHDGADHVVVHGLLNARAAVIAKHQHLSSSPGGGGGITLHSGTRAIPDSLSKSATGESNSILLRSAADVCATYAGLPPRL
jgi:hypothetical protein